MLHGEGEPKDEPGRLRAAHATGQLGPEVEALFAFDPGALLAGVQFLIGTNFTEAQAEPIAAAAGIEDLELSAPRAVVAPIRQRRGMPDRCSFASETVGSSGRHHEHHPFVETALERIGDPGHGHVSALVVAGQETPEEKGTPNRLTVPGVAPARSFTDSYPAPARSSRQSRT